MKEKRIESLKVTITIDYCEVAKCEFIYDVIPDDDLSSDMKHFLRWGLKDYIYEGHLPDILYSLEENL